MREVAGTAESAALLHPNVIISTISEDVKKEHSIIEESSPKEFLTKNGLKIIKTA
jgi:hypothetical protein